MTTTPKSSYILTYTTGRPPSSPYKALMSRTFTIKKKKNDKNSINYVKSGGFTTGWSPLSCFFVIYNHCCFTYNYIYLLCFANTDCKCSNKKKKITNLIYGLFIVYYLQRSRTGKNVRFPLWQTVMHNNTRV